MSMQPWRMVATAIAGLLFLSTGFAIISTPSFQIAYETEPPQQFCTAEGGCVTHYRLVIGNSGSKVNSADVIFSAEQLEDLVLPLKVVSAANQPRPFRTQEFEDILQISIPEIEPGRWVTITFSAKSTTANWETYLRAVSAEQGTTIEHAPTVLRFKRFLFSTL
jgi:hypothetical protein